MVGAKASVVGIVAFVFAASACAAIEGLDGYNACTTGCDGAAPSDESDAAEDVRTAIDAGQGSAEPGLDGGGSDDGAPGPGSDGGPGDDAPGDSGGPGDANNSGDGGPGGAACASQTGVDAGLLVYYPFEGDTNDRSGNGNNGIATSGTDVTYGPGKLGQGATVLPAGRGVAVTGSTILGPARTLCAWVNATPDTTGEGLPLFVGGAAGAADLYDVSAASPMDNCGSSQVANSLFVDHSGSTCLATSRTATPGSWSFACFQQSATSTTFFVDGRTFNLSSSNFSYALSTITVGSDRIGGSTTTQGVFNGQLDEVSIWSVSLSSTEMNVLYNGGSGCRLR